MDRRTREWTHGHGRPGGSAALLPAGSGAGLQPGRLRRIIPCFSVSIATESHPRGCLGERVTKVTLAPPPGHRPPRARAPRGGDAASAQRAHQRSPDPRAWVTGPRTGNGRYWARPKFEAGSHLREPASQGLRELGRGGVGTVPDPRFFSRGRIEPSIEQEAQRANDGCPTPASRRTHVIL